MPWTTMYSVAKEMAKAMGPADFPVHSNPDVAGFGDLIP